MKTLPLFLPIFSFFFCFLQANPNRCHIKSGQAQLTEKGAVLSIEAVDKTLLHWEDFSIGKEETTRFVLPHSSSSVLNRVIGEDPSHILGRLESNGRVYLINPKGIVFGEGAIVNTASFFASTLDACEEHFLKGKELQFKGESKEQIINLGKIHAWDGDIILIAHQVENHGSLNAEKGVVGLVSAQECLIQPTQKERIFIRINDAMEEGGVENTGWIHALQTELKAQGHPYSYAIKDSGKIDALSTQEEGGRIYLIAEEGIIETKGSYYARQLQEMGGEVKILSGDIRLIEGTTIDVSGEKGGGFVYIGEDFDRKEWGRYEANQTHIGLGVSIFADGLQQGDGGTVLIWSKEATSFLGDITVRGGEIGGHGGFVEVSSAGQLAAKGFVNALAPHGNTGTLLLDPSNVVIQAGGADPNAVFSGCGSPPGTYTFNAGATTIDHVALGLNLNTCSVIIDASATGLAATGSITVNDPVTWNPVGAPTSLTLRATDPLSFIAINDQIRSTKLGVAATTPLILIESSQIRIGDPTSTKNCGLETLSGGIEISAGSNLLTLLGGSGANANATIVTEGGGNISITLETTLNLTAGSGAQSDALIATRNGAGSITCQCGDNLTLTGGSGATSSIAEISTEDGNIFLSSGGQIALNGGNSSGNHAKIEVRSSSNVIDIEMAGLSLTGGTATLTDAEIVSRGGVISIDGRADLSGDIHLLGQVSSAQIRTIATLGTTADDRIQIGQKPGRILPENLTLTGGGGTSNASAIIVTEEGGNIVSNISGGYAINGGVSSLESKAGFFTGLNGSTGNITLQGETLIGIGGGGSGNNSAEIASSLLGGRIQIDLIDILQLTGGIAANQHAQIYTRGSGSNIDITAGSMVLNGSSSLGAANATAGLSTVTGNISVLTTNDIQVISGSELNAEANILSSAQGDLSFSCRDLLVAGGNSQPADAFITTQSGDILVTALRNCTFIGDAVAPSDVSVETFGSDLTITAGGSISILASTTLSVPANGDLLVIAGQDLTVDNTAEILVNGSGMLTLVVDNDFPSPPGIGPGKFILNAGGQITGGGPVRIFTAEQSQNAIHASINGQPFVPGTVFVDTNQERWGVYYFNPFFGGPSFTLFYKDSKGSPLSPRTDVSSELFFDLDFLDGYSFYDFFDWATFTVSFNRSKPLRSKQSLQSRQVIKNKGLSIRRKRNFNKVKPIEAIL